LPPLFQLRGQASLPDRYFLIGAFSNHLAPNDARVLEWLCQHSQNLETRAAVSP